MSKWDDQILRRICSNKKAIPSVKSLGGEVNGFIKRVVQPRQKKLAQLAQAWQELLPQELIDHSCLEDVRRGVLWVKVDDASTGHELDLLIREQLLERLCELCPAVSLYRIKIVRGRWYRSDDDGTRIPFYQTRRK